MTKLLRTPDHRFDNLSDFPYAPHYININDARIHYVDEGEGETLLCLHGNIVWSFIFRKFIAQLSPHYRVIAPDLIGFGRSDKYADIESYTYNMHLNMLTAFIERMNLHDATLVVHGWGGMLGLRALIDFKERFKRIVIMNTYLPLGNRPMPNSVVQWRKLAINAPSFSVGNIINHGMFTSLPPEVTAAYDAPFPTNDYMYGVRAFPAMLPDSAINPMTEQMKIMVGHMKIVRDELKKWHKPILLIFSEQGRIAGGGHVWYIHNVPEDALTCIGIENARHFMCEDKGTEIAGHIREFLSGTG